MASAVPAPMARRASRSPPAVACLLIAILTLGGALPPASGAGADESCPAPFGSALEVGSHSFLGGGTDPDEAYLDTLLMTGAQRTPARVIGFGDRLALVAEVKVDKDEAFTWGELIRFYSNATGWDTTPVWSSSLDPSEPYPVGFHVRPSAALWGGSLFVAWTAEGSPAGGPTDRLVLVRRVAADGSMDPWVIGSDTDPRRANQHPFLLPAGDTLYLTYAVGEGETDPAATHIAVREFDGTGFSSSQDIARPPAGWSDESPSLAWDGGDGLYAIWSRTNTSGLGATLMFSQRNTSGWGLPVELASVGHAADANAAVAFFGGKLLVAYTTDWAPDISGPDADVHWRSLDPATGLWSDAQSVNPQPSGGDDSGPAFSRVGDLLYVGWSTTDDFYARGSDSDPVYRVFDGTQLGPVQQLVPEDDVASDSPPRFVEVGGVTYAHWMWTPPVEPGQPRGDSREALRVVERPIAWFDGVSALYSFDAVSQNGSAHVVVSPTPAGIVPAGARLALRLADGSLYPLVPEGENHVAWAPVDPARPDFDVLACGTPISIAPSGRPLPGQGVDLVPYVTAGAVMAVAVAAYVVARGRRARP